MYKENVKNIINFAGKDKLPHLYRWYEDIAENIKELGTYIQIIKMYCQDKKMEFATEKCAMKRKKRKNKKNNTSQSRKHQITKKKKLQIPRDTRSGYHQANRTERKKVWKGYLKREQENFLKLYFVAEILWNK